MADNTILNPGVGGDTIMTEDPGTGAKIPVSKIRLGHQDNDFGDVSNSNPLPVGGASQDEIRLALKDILDQLKMGTLQVQVPLVVQDVSSTVANACSRQTVGVSSGTILGVNVNRKYAIVTNVGIYPVYLGLNQTPTTTSYHVALAACANSTDDGTGGIYTIPIWDGLINAISTNAAGAVCVTEML